MSIDFSEAPEWAVAMGESQGSRVWIGYDGYNFILDQNSVQHPFDEKGGHTLGSFKIIGRRPKTWTGEGLPPVGTVCVFNTAAVTDEEWHKLLPLRQDIQVTVIAHCTQPNGTPTAVFTFNCTGGLQVEMGVAELFKPVRTPEQIAAEEREAKAKAMYLSVYFAETGDRWACLPEATRDTFRKAIDAGWQQVKS